MKGGQAEGWQGQAAAAGCSLNRQQRRRRWEQVTFGCGPHASGNPNWLRVLLTMAAARAITSCIMCTAGRGGAVCGQAEGAAVHLGAHACMAATCTLPAWQSCARVRPPTRRRVALAAACSPPATASATRSPTHLRHPQLRQRGTQVAQHRVKVAAAGGDVRGEEGEQPPPVGGQEGASTVDDRCDLYNSRVHGGGAPSPDRGRARRGARACAAPCP